MLNHNEAMREPQLFSKDPVEFGRQLEGEKAHMRGLCLSMLGRFPDKHAHSDDLVQVAMIRAIRFAPQFRGECTRSSWLYEVTRRVVLDFLRKERRQGRAAMQTFLQNPLTADHDDLIPQYWVDYSAERRFVTKLESEVVLKRLSSLPSEQAATVIMKNMQDMTFREIAAVYGVPLSTTKTRYYKALRTLRQHFLVQ